MEREERHGMRQDYRAFTGRNLPRAADHNRLVVLDTIRELGAAARADIAYRTGLTTQTISNIVAEAFDAGNLEEAGAIPGSRGKPAALVRLKPGAHFALGVDIGPMITECVLVDFVGSVRSRRVETTRADLLGRFDVDWLATLTEALVEGSGIDRTRLDGIGVAAPGLVDRRERAIEDVLSLEAGELVGVGDRLEELTGVPVLVDNDAVAAVCGEVWLGGPERKRDFAYINLGSSVGSGIFLGGRVLRGSVGNPGAFGHTTCYEPGAAFEDGGHGPLESFCSDEWLVGDATRRLRAGTTSDLELSGTRAHLASDREAIMAAAVTGDPVAWATVTSSARILASAVLTLVNIIDLDLIILGGRRLGPARDLYREEVLSALETHSVSRRLHPFEVDFGAAGESAGAIGAAAMVLADRYADWGQ